MWGVWSKSLRHAEKSNPVSTLLPVILLVYPWCPSDLVHYLLTIFDCCIWLPGTPSDRILRPRPTPAPQPCLSLPQAAVRGKRRAVRTSGLRAVGGLTVWDTSWNHPVILRRRAHNLCWTTATVQEIFRWRSGDWRICDTPGLIPLPAQFRNMMTAKMQCSATAYNLRKVRVLKHPRLPYKQIFSGFKVVLCRLWGQQVVE